MWMSPGAIVHTAATRAHAENRIVAPSIPCLPSDAESLHCIDEGVPGACIANKHRDCRAHYLRSVYEREFFVLRQNVSVNIGSDDNATKIYVSNHLYEYLEGGNVPERPMRRRSMVLNE
jgi:hypothetical protein